MERQVPAARRPCRLINSMAYEPVYMVWDIYDGVRSGLASYEGAPHYFECEFDHAHGGYSEAYLLWPIDQQLLTLATEQWQIYRAWEMRFHRGELPVKTHPGNRGQSPRYDELEDQIDRHLTRLRGFALGSEDFRSLADGYSSTYLRPKGKSGCSEDLGSGQPLADAHNGSPSCFCAPRPARKTASSIAISA